MQIIFMDGKCHNIFLLMDLVGWQNNKFHVSKIRVDSILEVELKH